MLLYHFGEVTAHTKFRYIPVIEIDADRAVIIGIYNKVGNDLLHVTTDGFTQ